MRINDKTQASNSKTIHYVNELETLNINHNIYMTIYIVNNNININVSLPLSCSLDIYSYKYDNEFDFIILGIQHIFTKLTNINLQIIVYTIMNNTVIDCKSYSFFLAKNALILLKTICY